MENFLRARLDWVQANAKYVVPLKTPTNKELLLRLWVSVSDGKECAIFILFTRHAAACCLGAFTVLHRMLALDRHFCSVFSAFFRRCFAFGFVVVAAVFDSH